MWLDVLYAVLGWVVCGDAVLCAAVVALWFGYGMLWYAVFCCVLLCRVVFWWLCWFWGVLCRVVLCCVVWSGVVSILSGLGWV